MYAMPGDRFIARALNSLSQLKANMKLEVGPCFLCMLLALNY